MKISRRTTKGMLWFLLAALSLTALFLLARNRKIPTAQLQAQVVDGQSEKPLSGCIVVVPEAGLTCTTDENGNTPILTVPLVANAAFDNIFPQTWGEVTLLVYRDGYLPYALFHAQVFADSLREGPRIYLFAQDGSMEDQPFSVIEGPPREWVNGLLERFAPAEDAPTESSAP